MCQFEGGAIILVQQDFRSKNVLLAWKGIHVHYDPAPSDQLNNGQHVKFAVGFSLRGIHAISVEHVLTYQDAPCSEEAVVSKRQQQ